MTTPLKCRRRMPCMAFTSLAFSLVLGLSLPWSLAAQTPAPDAPPAELPPVPPKPKTHAELHAEAHEQAVAKARALDPVMTPKARYTRQVEGVIGKLWHQYSFRHHLTAPGRVEVTFYVTKKGVVEGLVIQDAKQSNVELTEVSLRAVADAKLPPMPAEVYPTLPEADPERLRFDFNFMIAPPDPEEKKKPKTKDKEKTKTPVEEAKPKTAAAVAPAPPTLPSMNREGESWQQWLMQQKPLMEYHAQVSELLATGWKQHLAKHRDSLPGGQVRMSFRVKPSGGVARVLILDKEAPTRLKNAGLAVIHGAQFPPMPPKLAALFAGQPESMEGLRVPCTFSVGSSE